ncbi:MAG: family 20 glycosylhydrolase [Anaerolineaceae bacterium]|nr:family 20 glycosylhydrolase [Anaerolineaceae bacterium]
MSAAFLLLPEPRRRLFGEGGYSLSPQKLILLHAQHPQDLLPAAGRFQVALSKLNGMHWEQTASNAVPSAQLGLTLRVAPDRSPQPQGYRLHITPDGILIEGHEPAGVFYGVCTLIQLLEQSDGVLPFCEIQDWPDFPARGVMLDVSRDKVYRMETLFELVDRLASWKINQVQLYTEHTFAYRNHPVVWEKASPMTGEEIMALDAFCRERYIELVPNQNSFGHLEHWLIHPAYAQLAETHAEFETPWGTKMKGPFSLAPENPGSLAFITSLYDELLPHFNSRQFNIGCDETIDLGKGASREICAQRGTGRVYLDFILKLYADIKRRGYTMQFWGDIINDHPELVPELPRDVIAMEWGYEAEHPFDRNSERFAASGVPFYVCPGTSTWGSLAGRTDNALANLVNAAENGLKHGAIGYLITDWGDAGHWQVPPASYLGFVMGAAYSWALEANRQLNPVPLVSRFAFEDPSGTMGKIVFDLGNIYRIPSTQVSNGSVLFWVLQLRLPEILKEKSPTQESLMRTLEAIDRAIAPLAASQMSRPDADLIKREYINTARLLRHGARRILLAQAGMPADGCMNLAVDLKDIIDEFRSLWLVRNRPGGLEDSAGRLEAAYRDYLI